MKLSQTPDLLDSAQRALPLFKLRRELLLDEQHLVRLRCFPCTGTAIFGFCLLTTVEALSAAHLSLRLSGFLARELLPFDVLLILGRLLHALVLELMLLQLEMQVRVQGSHVEDVLARLVNDFGGFRSLRGQLAQHDTSLLRRQCGRGWRRRDLAVLLRLTLAVDFDQVFERVLQGCLALYYVANLACWLQKQFLSRGFFCSEFLARCEAVDIEETLVSAQGRSLLAQSNFLCLALDVVEDRGELFGYGRVLRAHAL